MKSTQSLSVIAAALLFSVSLARGQGGPDPSVLAGKIANWPAPAYWSPPDQPVSVQEREDGLKRETVEALSTSPLPFIGITPCRIADTRGNGFTGAYGPPALVGNGPARTFNIPAGPCSGIPSSAGAYSINVAAILPATDGFMTIFPTGTAQPNSSDLNFLAGEAIANALIVSAGTLGSIDVFVNTTTDIILDINGYYAGSGVGSSNTFLGSDAGNFTMTGGGNTGIGASALRNNTTGFFNTATGIQALWHNTTGHDNTATGWAALGENISGAGNTAVGSGALLANTTANSNTATGAAALGVNTEGTGNTATGSQALLSNTTGNFNTATGKDALGNNTTGGFNTAIGVQALLINTTGGSNIAVGENAGSFLTTGSDNIDIGNRGVPGETGTVRIGRAGFQLRAFLAGVRGVTTDAADGLTVLIDSNGQLGTISSSARVKRKIIDMGEASSPLLQLRPVSFFYRNDTEAIRQYGLIAEEVAQVMPELVQFSAVGEAEAVRYHFLPTLLLNELQKQHRTAEAQQKMIEQQKETIDREQAEIDALKARLSRLEAQPLGFASLASWDGKSGSNRRGRERGRGKER